MEEVDTGAALEFLQRWSPEGPWVLTAIEPSRKGINTQTFRLVSLEQCRRWIEEHNGRWNIYFHVNTVMRDLSKKAEREDIRDVDWLHVDIDPRAGEDIVKERERALGLLESPPGNIPPPTVIVFSGGGYQGFWRLQDPIDIHGDLSLAEDAKRYNQQIETLFAADNCHNIDRIMRLPGTMNVPDALKRKKGREPTLARLIKFDESLVYPLSRFTPAPMVQTADDFALGRPTVVKVSGNIRRLEDIHELDEWGVPDRCKVICVTGSNPDEGPKAGDNSRSAWLFDALCQLVRSGVPDDIIYSVITDPGFAISSSVLDKGSNGEKYALRQIARAKEEAEEPWLRVLNDKHAVISDMGGKCRVIQEVWDPTLKRFRISKQSFEDFRNRYMNKFVELGVDANGKPIRAAAGKWWLGHPQRRQFESIVFAPNQDVKDMYNLWKGFACEAIPGDCSLLLEHVRTNVCSGNEEYFRYLIGWCATAVQHPDAPGQVAVIMRGPQGVGKSFFAKKFGALFGRHFLQVSDSKHLVGSFNAHLRDCVVLFGDEAFYAGDKRHESILKTLVTEETIIIEGKGVDAEAAPNYTHIIMASNAQWVVPAGGGERRYFVLDVGKEQMQNSDYFAKIESQWARGGGKEAFLHYLMTYDLSEFDVRAVPKTLALNDQKLLSMNPEEEWWYNKLAEGRLLYTQDGWETSIMKDDLMTDYFEYMKRLGINRRASATGLGKFLQRVVPGTYPRSVQKRATLDVMGRDGYSTSVERRVYFYEFPPLHDCRAHWDESFGGGQDWEPQQTGELGA